jgi:hypothetical protein
VWAGLPASEAAHDVASGHAPVVSSRLSLYRDATDGWVSWKLNTGGAEHAKLEVGYLGGAAAAFDLFVEGKLLAEERPQTPAPVGPNRETVTTLKSYTLPLDMLKNRAVVEVRFTGQAKQGPCRIVLCRLLRN